MQRKGIPMTNQRVIARAILGGTALLMIPSAGFAAATCARVTQQEAIGAALLDKYVADVNRHDTRDFPALFTDSYIQHSGRSPSGLAAQIENSRRLDAAMPDRQIHVEDCIIAGDKIVARNTYSATFTQPILGFAPTGKPFTFRTIDIWRVENGKLAEHWDLTDTEAVLRKLSGGS
jgi:predicted ester cyclase